MEQVGGPVDPNNQWVPEGNDNCVDWQTGGPTHHVSMLIVLIVARKEIAESQLLIQNETSTRGHRCVKLWPI